MSPVTLIVYRTCPAPKHLLEEGLGGLVQKSIWLLSWGFCEDNQIGKIWVLMSNHDRFSEGWCEGWQSTQSAVYRYCHLKDREDTAPDGRRGTKKGKWQGAQDQLPYLEFGLQLVLPFSSPWEMRNLCFALKEGRIYRRSGQNCMVTTESTLGGSGNEKHSHSSSVHGNSELKSTGNTVVQKGSMTYPNKTIKIWPSQTGFRQFII